MKRKDESARTVGSGVTRWGASLFVCASFLMLASLAGAQTFTSGSDASDGTYAPSGPPGTVVIFNPANFGGTQVAANIFNFSSISIPAGVTVRFSGSVVNAPVIWLSQGDVTIAGALDLSGGSGHAPTGNPFQRIPSVPGSGGYAGGAGALGSAQRALPGDGPGGGAIGSCAGGNGYGHSGQFSGNSFLVPLVGGSGGSGAGDACGGGGGGGGAGGGALLIASSTQILINGGASISVDGGNYTGDGLRGGGGSGGSMRLIANTIRVIGHLSAIGGRCDCPNPGGGPGVVRLEAATIAFPFPGSVAGTLVQSGPFPLLLPTAGPSIARVISIGGVPIVPNPSSFPDITINTTSAVPVVIQTQNIPVTATIVLTILNQNGVPDTVIPVPPLGNCDLKNVCTTTVNVVFPFGASRGLTKVTWTP